MQRKTSDTGDARISERPLSTMTMWDACGPSRISGAAGAGDEARVGGHILAGAGAGEHAEQREGILHRRDDLFDRSDDDVHFGQCVHQIGIAFVGDDDSGARFRDQEVGSGDAHVCCQELLAQNRTGFRDQCCGIVEPSVFVECRMAGAEIGFNLRFGQMDGRRDDVAWPFAADLHDVLAEVRLDDLNAFAFEVGVEINFVGNHRFRFGDEPCAGFLADAEDDLAGFLRCRRPMHARPGGNRTAFEGLEIKVEVSKGTILDVARDGSVGFELGEARLGGGALRHEPARADHRARGVSPCWRVRSERHP